MRASEIGTDLKTSVEVRLKWEDISGGMQEQNQVKSSDLEEKLGDKLEQMKTFVQAKLDHQQQQMKDFVCAEIAKVKASPIPECPVCLLQLKPPKKIVLPEGPQDLQAMQRNGGSGVLPHLQDCL